MEVLKNSEGVVRFTSEKIKVKCSNCRYNEYLSCGKFPRKITNKFTDQESDLIYKENLNSNGECPYYKTKKKNWIKRIFNY